VAWGIGLAALLALPAAAEDVDTLMARAQLAFDRADIVSSMDWYRRAAERGHAPAQTRLAYLLDKSEANEEAAAWYRKAAEQDHWPAVHGLAELYATGEGVPRDDAEARELFERAARAGYTPSVRVLALAYEKGELGLRPSYENAVTWLQAGVSAGDASSIERLARAYRLGELGLRVNRGRAAELEARLPPGTRGKGP
jgi:TPR repeat protein